MFERIIEFIKELPVSVRKDQVDDFGPDDPRLAAAALLYRIMLVDGDKHEHEKKRLAEMLTQAYGVKGEALQKLLTAAKLADQETSDLNSFTNILNKHLDHQARLHFMGLMWAMVYADGQAHEVEDTMIWRIADLIGISEEERLAIEQNIAAKIKA